MAGRRAKGSAKRTLLLDTAEKLIVDEGYAAVTTRRVALEAGLKPPLVHYYFPTTDDLLLAVYARAAEQAHQRALDALASDKPLEAFWALSKTSAHSALGTELYALANHRKAIRTQAAETGLALRAKETEALESAAGAALDPDVADAKGLLVLLSGVARILVMEEAVGLTDGHAEVKAMIDRLLQRAVRKPDAP